MTIPIALILAAFATKSPYESITTLGSALAKRPYFVSGLSERLNRSGCLTQSKRIRKAGRCLRSSVQELAARLPADGHQSREQHHPGAGFGYG